MKGVSEIFLVVGNQEEVKATTGASTQLELLPKPCSTLLQNPAALPC